METKRICPSCQKTLPPNVPLGLCPECLIKSGFNTGTEPGNPGKKSGFEPPIEEIRKLFLQLEILELIGKGGMGAVFKARQPALDRFVALKILPPDPGGDSGFAERFNREARALARLNHPHIVAVHDFGKAGTLHYLVMEFVDGSNLRQVEQAGRLTPEQALEIVPQICEALQFAHNEGIVHRDIKPENILLDKKGRVKITDFGIAKILGVPAGKASLTGAKDVIGTPHYMAPEQVEKPQTVDHRADIYSLGVVFYEMLTGELPLGKFEPPSKKVQMDVRLDEVVLHSLEKEPERRYQQVGLVKTDVETIAATPGGPVPPKARSAPPIPRAERRTIGMSSGWKTAIVVGALGLAALLLVLGLVVLISGVRLIRKPAPEAVNLISSNAFWVLLNEDQRLVAQWINRQFHSFDDARTFEGWSNQERVALERRLLDTLRGPHTADFYKAINSLAALRSTNALPLLREMAFEHVDKLLRSEISNRRRWMAARALGRIGDRTVVPELIHLLYHNNSQSRWCAQISLVQLTGQNFGGDWEVWGKWWNAQNGQPPFNPGIVRWWKGQAEPDKLAEITAENDRKFIQGLRARFPEKQASAGPETTSHKVMNHTLMIWKNEKVIPNPTEADIRAAVMELDDSEIGPRLLLSMDGAATELELSGTPRDGFGLDYHEGQDGYVFASKRTDYSAEEAMKVLIGFRNGSADWKTRAEWKKLKM